MDTHPIFNSWLAAFRFCRRHDGSFDLDRWDEWCRESADNGAAGGRVLAFAPWGQAIEELITPYKLDPIQSAWDLDQWNEDYFALLRTMVDRAAKHSYRVMFVLFDNCQFHRASISPWACNVQGRPDYYHDLPRSLAWVDKVLDVLGTDVDYEICNEGSFRAGSTQAQAVAWYVAIFDRLLAAGIPEDRICWGAVSAATYQAGTWEDDRPRNLQAQVLSAVKHRPGKIQAYRAMHNVGVAGEVKAGVTFPASYAGEWALAWWGGPHVGRPFLSDDGVGNGGSSDDYAEPYRRPSAGQWHEVARLIFQRCPKANKVVIERCPKNYSPSVWGPALRAIALARFEVLGAWPENWGKHPKPAPEPIPEPPAPPPQPIEPRKDKARWILAAACAALGLLILALAIL